MCGIKKSLLNQKVMRLKNLPTLILVILSTFSFLTSASLFAEERTVTEIAETTQLKHGLHSWWGKAVVSAEVEIVFGGNVVVAGTFTFEAHGPKARYDRPDGATVYYDGSTAWIYPPGAADERGRFHVLTWPWFIMAPFKVQGDGIVLSEPETIMVDSKPYQTLLQTFESGTGDTPDDWYRFYIDPKTHLIDAMSYIVTYGKDLEAANAQASIIKYFDYTSVDGPVISTRYEFWYWDKEAKVTTGADPKGTGTVTNIQYPQASEVRFMVPEGARELKMP